MDNLIPVSNELTAKIQEAGNKNFNDTQLATVLDISEPELRLLMYDHPELQSLRAKMKIKKATKYLQWLEEVADGKMPENKYQVSVAKYLYEMFSGYSTDKSSVNIAIQNVHPRENNMRLVEILPTETVTDIDND